MLKDVGMTVPKIRETRAVYNYAAIQGMRACNNNNMRNPKIKGCREGLLHAVLLHIRLRMLSLLRDVTFLRLN